MRLQPDQAAALLARAPDIVCLQEVTRSTLPLWVASLDGYHVRVAKAEPHGRRLGVLLAARDALADAPQPLLERPESAVAAQVAGLHVVSAHVPNAANGWVKPQTLAALAAHLVAVRTPKVLAGDLNAPRRELADGTIWSFARDGRGRLRPERGEAWDAGELAPLTLAGMADTGPREPTWAWPHGGGWRLDHVIASAELEPVTTHHHGWRTSGLSDHSAVEAELLPARQCAGVAGDPAPRVT